MSTSLADSAVTPTALLAELRTARAAADAAEVRVLEVAVEWAHSHPVLEGEDAWRIGPSSAQPLCDLDGTALAAIEADDSEAFEWCGIPPVRWDAPAVFAAANQMSTAAGRALIRDALVLRHRLPKIWARTLAGEAQAWRARRIAQAVIAAPDDVVAYVDGRLAPMVGTVGAIKLERVVDEAMLHLHAEQRELEQLEALDHHHVTLIECSINDAGVADMEISGDWKDLHDFDQAVARVAAALAAQGNVEPLGVRRSMALGVLADPAQAHALLEGQSAPAASKQAVLYLHLTDLALLGLDAAGHNDSTGRAVLTQQVQQWLARADTSVVVKPVIDLADHIHTESYDVPERLREQVGLIDPTCVFPWCTKPARACDCDHIDAFADGGPTCTHNLAPLCRQHHRLKTHAGWSYRRIEPRVHLWTDPHGAHYLRDRGGTSVVAQT